MVIWIVHKMLYCSENRVNQNREVDTFLWLSSCHVPQVYGAYVVPSYIIGSVFMVTPCKLPVAVRGLHQHYRQSLLVQKSYLYHQLYNIPMVQLTSQSGLLLTNGFSINFFKVVARTPCWLKPWLVSSP